MAASVYSDYYKGQNGVLNGVVEDDFNYTDPTYEKDKPTKMNNKKIDNYQKSLLEDKSKINAQTKQRKQQDYEANSSDEDLIALLKVTISLISSNTRINN